ncbi:chemotaxis response regulator protein-glutamate methylesterase [Bacillus daqingensis]|uniref:Protein-glutamate methylesterase/protein-glutamine glutaminase n=1 Tax=Bacillus daqingensis TaxID=872396 RepID=A0ABV9NUP0_9BACI
MTHHRVLVVDDSAFMRKVISDAIELLADFTVCGRARNGREAIIQARLLKPDIITLDVEMPIMTGLEALPELLKTAPVNVIMVSSLTSSGTEETMKALSAGAVDFIAKPDNGISSVDRLSEELACKLRAAAEAQYRPVSLSAPVKRVPNVQSSGTSERAVVIGTSTGGPKALQMVLPLLPKDLPCPVFIVQHMPAGFTASLSKRLNNLSAITVKEAESGEIAKNGVAYIAPGGYHLTMIRKGTNVSLQLDQEKPVHGHRPAVDVLFTSAAKAQFEHVTAVILTGMGKDGAEGLKQIASHSPYTCLSESEASCIVYGMPRAAESTGLVTAVHHLHEMAAEIVRRC